MRRTILRPSETGPSARSSLHAFVDSAGRGLLLAAFVGVAWFTRGGGDAPASVAPSATVATSTLGGAAAELTQLNVYRVAGSPCDAGFVASPPLDLPATASSDPVFARFPSCSVEFRAHAR